MSEIQKVLIRKIIDSRGEPTVEIDVFDKDGFGRASAPSGASRGRHEVPPYSSKGIDHDIETFRREIAPKLAGMDCTNQTAVDHTLHELDGTDDFSRIGGNIAIATSLAVAKAAANAKKMPLFRYLLKGTKATVPLPLGNVIGGGLHTIRGPDIQEFLSLSTSSNVSKNVFANALVHSKIREKLISQLPNESLGRGDEGAWAARLSDEEAIEILVETCDEVTNETGVRCKPALDMAASQLYKKGKYRYKEGALLPDDQIDFVADLVSVYDLALVEDPLQEEDFHGFSRLTEMVGDRCLIVGDDLFVTNVKRLQKGIEEKAANAVLVKPNQIGTLTETREVVETAHNSGYKTVISHRSGETTDAAISHLGVAFGCYAIKCGAVSGERIAKLNELIRIKEEIGRSG